MGTVRRRQNGASKAQQKAGNTASPATTSKPQESSPTAKDDDDDDERTTKQIILRHPLFWLLVLGGIPYSLHLGRRFVLLRHPNWIPFLQLRPAVSSSTTDNNTRQVLVVGSIASGTSQVSHELSAALNLEVGHESSDAEWSFVRDGSVSWLHGIRFLDPSHAATTVPALCNVGASLLQWNSDNTNNYGFGQTTFGSPKYSKPFLHPNFQDDWISECKRLVGQEYGCAVVAAANANANNNRPPCQHTPFARTLLQLRDPRRIAKSLDNKFCHDLGGTPRAAQLALLRLFTALFFPLHKELALNVFLKTPRSVENCAWQVTHYVIWWYGDVLLPAMNLMDGQYQIESSGVCHVGAQAGLNDASTTVYAPNHEFYRDYCINNVTNAQRVFGRTQNVGKKKKKKRKAPSSVMLQFRGQSQDEIEKVEAKLEELAIRMGYD